MSVVLRDGKGTEKTCRVTQSNQLATFATMVPLMDATTVLDGVVFNIYSGLISLTTTASFNAIIYVSNNGSFPINILTQQLSSNVAGQWRVTKNPTGGTIISDATAAAVANRNLGSTKTLSGIAYKAGGDAKTVTGGTEIDGLLVGDGDHQLSQTYIIPPGQSMAWEAKPSASGVVAVRLVVSNMDMKDDLE